MLLVGEITKLRIKWNTSPTAIKAVCISLCFWTVAALISLMTNISSEMGANFQVAGGDGLRGNIERGDAIAGHLGDANSAVRVKKHIKREVANSRSNSNKMDEGIQVNKQDKPAQVNSGKFIGYRVKELEEEIPNGLSQTTAIGEHIGKDARNVELQFNKVKVHATKRTTSKPNDITTPTQTEIVNNRSKKAENETIYTGTESHNLEDLVQGTQMLEEDKVCDVKVPSRLHLTFYREINFDLDFRTFISWRSAVIFYTPATTYIWVEDYHRQPNGSYWEEFLEKSNHTQVIVSVRKLPVEINNRVLHVQDRITVLYLEILKEYGGLYFSNDLVACRDLTRYRCQETSVALYEATSISDDFIMAKADSNFVAKWYESYVNRYDPDKAELVSKKMPRILAAQLHKRVQVLRNLAAPDLTDKRWLYTRQSYWNFTSRTSLAVKLHYNSYNITHTPETIKGLRTTMGRLFRLIYYGSTDAIHDVEA